MNEALFLIFTHKLKFLKHIAPSANLYSSNPHPLTSDFYKELIGMDDDLIQKIHDFINTLENG